jgi:hypothetical protein
MCLDLRTRITKWSGEATLTDWIMAVSTVCIFFVAVIAAGISFFQWREMHSGGTDTHDLALAAKAQADATKAEADAMRDLAARALRQAEATDNLVREAQRSASAAVESAKDADVSAKATKDMEAISAASLENARQSERLDQRPWVYVSSMRLTKFQSNSKFEAHLQFGNSGRSPALHMEVVGNLVIMNKSANPDFLPPTPLTSYISLRALAPQGGNDWTFESKKVLSADDKDDVERSSQVIWFWGFVRYDDAVGVPHLTQFCGNTLSNGVVSRKASEGMELSLCPNQNGMD